MPLNRPHRLISIGVSRDRSPLERGALIHALGAMIVDLKGPQQIEFSYVEMEFVGGWKASPAAHHFCEYLPRHGEMVIRMPYVPEELWDHQPDNLLHPRDFDIGMFHQAYRARRFWPKMCSDKHSLTLQRRLGFEPMLHNQDAKDHGAYAIREAQVMWRHFVDHLYSSYDRRILRSAWRRSRPDLFPQQPCEEEFDVGKCALAPVL